MRKAWQRNARRHLEKTFEVMGTIMLGSGLRNIIGLASRETSHLQHDEFVIICGGANDINKNESNICLRNIRKFALQNKHTNVITIPPPHRHDLQGSSCINGEIQVYNRKLHKMLKDMYHVTIINTLHQRRFHSTWSPYELSGQRKASRDYRSSHHKFIGATDFHHQFKLERRFYCDAH